MQRFQSKFSVLALFVLTIIPCILTIPPTANAEIKCYECHGTKNPPDYRPVDAPFRDISSGGFPGNHRNHMLADATPTSCDPCHAGPGGTPSGYSSNHRDGNIQLSSNLNASPLAARYKNTTTAFPQTSNPVPGTCSNVNCHFEKTTPVWGSPKFTYPGGCYGSCHGSPPVDSAGVITGSHSVHAAMFPGLGNCSKCHPDHTSEAAPFAHAAKAAARRVEVIPADGFGAYTGGAGRYLPSQTNSYGYCSGFTCHSNGTSVATGVVSAPSPIRWGSSSSGCNGCHGNPPDYASGAPKANSHTSHGFYACNSCHINTTSDGVTITGQQYHLNQTYDVNAGAGVSFSYSFAASGGTCNNISCHGGNNATWGSSASSGIHNSTLGSGFILMGINDSDHGTDHGITENCSLCHYENLVTQHANNCSLCHAGAGPPAGLGGSWNKTCQQGSCHPSFHTEMQPDHNGIYWNSSSSCALCHDTSGPEFPGPGDNCSRCHDPATIAAAVGASDITPPTTTSSFNPAAGAIFNSNKAVTLTATDNSGGSGVYTTYYRIDSGSFVAGTSFTVSGEGLHTFSYYSVDNADNTESSHISNTFRIDTVAPSTACSAVNGSAYTGAQTFTLTASDTGGSGVAGTWSQLDTGSWAAGSSVAVPAPESGTVSHTISWYSRDNATNQEVTKSVTFTVQAPASDTTPPTTISSFNPSEGAVFNANQPVTLTATDNSGGTGVQATYYKIDSGSFTAGTTFTVSGEGFHTFSYYSVDNSNNTESTHISNSFRIDTVAPSTTCSAGNGSTYTGAQTFTLAPSDPGGSGVAGTWYQLDNGVWTAGTSIAVPAPASGSASHTISWYSRDNAGNQETTKSATMIVQAPVTTGFTTLSFRTSGAGGWFSAYWAVLDAEGNMIADFWNDDGGGHPEFVWWDYVVPSGQGYTMVGEVGPEPDGPWPRGTRSVSPVEAAPGATIEWWY